MEPGKKTESRVARLVNAQIELLKGEKTQAQIAYEAGYPKPNIITMFKQGLTRVPMANVVRVAKALEVDPVRLARMMLQEYEPELWQALVSVLGEPITENELKLLRKVRELTNDGDYEVTESDELEALEKFTDVLNKNNAKAATTTTY